MDVSEAKRLRALEDENRKLKKLLAEAMLDQAALKELLAKNGRARRQAGGRRPSAEQIRDERVSGLHRDRRRPQDGAIPFAPTRPHSSLKYQTPAAFAASLAATGPRAVLRDGFALGPVAQPAPEGVSNAEALIAAG
jgi:hypothetical protein